MSNRSPQSEAPGRPPQPQTTPAQGERQQRTPREPHERDESTDSQAPTYEQSDPFGPMGYDDLMEGQQDTGRKPVLEDTYERLKDGAGKPVTPPGARASRR